MDNYIFEKLIMYLVFTPFTRLRALQKEFLFTDKTSHGMSFNYVSFLMLQNTLNFRVNIYLYN